MKLQVNETAVRVALVAFNFIFSILSVALIALGVVYVDDLVLPKRYIGLDFFELPTLLIVLGSLSFVASLAGCYCARTDSPKLTKCFIVFLSVLLALELIISLISFFNMRRAISSKISSTMEDELDEDPDYFHSLEKNYRCCGINGPEDYVSYDNESAKPFCCLTNGEDICTIEYLNTTTTAIKSGCATVVADVIHQIALEIGCYSTVSAVLQSLEIICVFFRTVG